MRAGQSGKRGAAVGLLLGMLLTGCGAEDAVQAPAGAGQGVPTDAKLAQLYGALSLIHI